MDKPDGLELEFEIRYNNFLDLHTALGQSGYRDLPAFPQKKYFMSAKDKEARQKGLENYMRALVDRKELRNSPQVIKFLNL